MDRINEIELLLEQLPQPAFLVKDDKLVYANTLAKSLGFDAGQDIAQYLQDQMDKYHEMPDGQQELAVFVGEYFLPAITIRLGACDLFKLSHQDQDSVLSALSIAAQYMRAPLSDAMLAMDNMEGEYAPLLRRSLTQLHRAVSNMSDATVMKNPRHNKLTYCHIPSLFADIIEKVKALTDRENIPLHYQGTARSVYSQVDVEKLTRGILNIIVNAIKFRVPGTPVYARLDIDKQQISFTVSNEITDEFNFKGDLFKSFQRTPHKLTHNEGLGLGMTIAQGAARAHNGNLLVALTGENTIRVNLSFPIRTASDTTLCTPVTGIPDYYGGYDGFVTELSEILSRKIFEAEY